MTYNKLEIEKGFVEINITDCTNIDVEEIIELKKNKSLIINLEINNLMQLNHSDKFNILRIEDTHVSVLYTKQAFLVENLSKIANESIIKSVDVENKRIRINFYTSKELSESVIENNFKILERIKYIPNDVKLHSKNYEILYQANQILKAYKKSDDTKKELVNKINALHRHASKL
ncbi:hypothetical protein [Corticicoccus populi]|uniref:DUF1905 domain-containing protein n=1 Tax=Corticicoccus populi TaxID=1812821 RepID=A0ABW5WVJ5_9STAP